MPETTPTQPSAHLIQGNSSASRPGAHMPVTFEGDEPEATQMQMVKSWRPGVEWEQDDEYAAHGVAEALGEMLLTVVDIHKPGRFPTRVFYTRQWKDPNGKVFGKAGLRITTLDAFRRRLRGYMHEFWLDGEKQPNARNNRLPEGSPVD